MKKSKKFYQCECDVSFVSEKDYKKHKEICGKIGKERFDAKIKKQKGFIQIPILIIIIIGVFVLGGAGYVGVRQYQTKQDDKRQLDEEAEKSRQIREKQTQDLIAVQQASLEETKLEIENLKKNSKNISKKTEEEVSMLKKTIASEKSDNQTIDYSKLPIKSVVQLICNDGNFKNGTMGSGVYYPLGSTIETNAHMINYNKNEKCFVVFREDERNPNKYKTFYTDVAYVSKKYDYAFLNVRDGLDIPTVEQPKSCNRKDIHLGDKLVIVGFPSVGGNTVTLTEGIVSGFDGQYIKTSAKIEHGNSGGGAFHHTGCLIGIPSEVVVGGIESLGRILITSDLFLDF